MASLPIALITIAASLWTLGTPSARQAMGVTSWHPAILPLLFVALFAAATWATKKVFDQ